MGRPCSRGGISVWLRPREGNSAEVIECYAVENDAKRIRFVPQLRGRRSEYAPAKFALPELDNLQLLAARAFAYEASAAAVRAADGRYDGMRHTSDAGK